MTNAQTRSCSLDSSSAMMPEDNSYPAHFDQTRVETKRDIAPILVPPKYKIRKQPAPDPPPSPPALPAR